MSNITAGVLSLIAKSNESTEVHNSRRDYCTIIAERSEANNRDLWASESQLAFIYIYIYLSVTLSRPRGGGGGASHVFKMATPTVTWMPSSNSWRRKRQRSGQVYSVVLSSKAYYSSQVSRVCVAIL